VVEHFSELKNKIEKKNVRIPMDSAIYIKKYHRLEPENKRKNFERHPPSYPMNNKTYCSERESQMPIFFLNTKWWVNDSKQRGHEK
jgi:hypothetical protein